MEQGKIKVICIVGPTASGKTSLGIELAKQVGGEILSADSMQIYQDLNIGTAKVTKEEACGIKHHLIDICKVDEKFSVADYQKMCYDKIDELVKKKKVPIIVGGTGLYVSSVVHHMQFDQQPIDYSYRESLEKLVVEKGQDYLYEKLQEVDSESAKVIHKNNVRRVIRALEIAHQSSQTKSKHMEEEKIRRKQEDSNYQFDIFCIKWDKELLWKRMNQRIEQMVKEGLVNEAKYVYDLQLDASYTCMQAIGYKEFFPYFKGESSLEDCIERLKIETRKYAKRQMTWFRHQLECTQLDGTKSTSILVNEIVKHSFGNKG